MYGGTRVDKIKNKYIKSRLEIMEITGKMI